MFRMSHWSSYCLSVCGCKAHIPNIQALNSDTQTLFSNILILNSQCVGVAIEGMDIWYMGLILLDLTLLSL